MTGAVQSIRTAIPAPANAETLPLREGSVVSVKVLNDNGNGRFTVFFNGRRFNVASKTPLKSGETFLATVGFDKNGTVILKTQTQTSLVQTKEQNPLINFLKNLGLTPDAVNLKLLSFMQQTGFKLDRKIISKARIIASRFPQKQKQAAEAAAILLKKGLSADDATVESLIYLGEKSENQNQHKKNDGEASKSEESFLQKIYSSALPQNGGPLTLINHIKNEGGKHWLILPFEWEYENQTARGKIRILMDTNRRETEKIVISCKFNVTNYFFVLYYKQSMVKEVRFCTLPALLTDNTLPSEKLQGDFLISGMNSENPVSVIYSTSALTDGLCCNDEEPVSFDERL